MFEQHLKIIKIHFSILTFVVIFCMSIGALFLSNIFHNESFYFYFTKDYIQKNISYFQYKYEFDKNIKKPLAAAGEGMLLSLPVLVYHGIISSPDASNVTLSNFKKQMFALQRAGYQTVTLAEAYDFLQGKKTLPAKSFLLTFDDGRKDSYYPVDPILQTLGYSGVNFVISSHSAYNSKNNYYLTLGELKQMQNSGRWEIGAHAHVGHDLETIDESGATGHFFANKLWIQTEKRLETDDEFYIRIETEMQAAKNLLQQKLNSAVLGFAFPFGDYGQESINYPGAKDVVLEITKKLYPMAFYQVPSEPTNEKRNYPLQNTFLVKRIEVRPHWTEQELMQILQMTEDKSLPFFDTFESAQGWKNVWGDFEYTDQGILISATASTTGSMTILDGAYLWKDYIFESDVELKQGETYTLIGRYKDGDNLVSCKFGTNRVTLEQKVNNIPKILYVWKDRALPSSSPISLGISVKGKNVECLENHKSIGGTNMLDESLDRGSVGFSIWDPILGTSQMLIHTIRVQNL
ncbi:MAG: hypothetical protein A3B90_00795 [Candidatus Magasanikbacteria bacterium RIFCSPHIGHO2_02_FULL_41_13]|uniref:NodB homology domain-containing protein n=1 Tax=Candidatus Magasanikbacteria bacterium RIFCSPHIGHO2_02_FULL_41_13 TaxID=1798676 RepID=A0A1F6M4F9_9BACT|nr:MAG: hypothetical protein A3B90_00795 [Candidatus Magasanikbacteria bacterium RIFCSPHIGHO2_02_FULL_41_13]